MQRDSLFETRGTWPQWTMAQHVALVKHTDKPPAKEEPANGR